MKLKTLSFMVGCWLAYNLISYGISYLVLKYSKNWRDDLWWSVVLTSVPYGLCQWIWLQAWRAGEMAEMKAWSMLIVGLACSVAGSTLAMFIYFKAMPSVGSLVGLALACAGAAIAILFK